MRRAGVAVCLCWLLLAGDPMPAIAADTAASAAWSADIGEIRRLAALVPGARATRINVEKFAESRRSKKFAVRGAADEPSVQARTAYQVVFPDGPVLIDAGMNEQIHRFFGRGTAEPYFPDAARRVEQGLRAARLILLTHEHGDHAGGVIDTPLAAQLAPKTVLTRGQVQSLMSAPQVPEIRLTEQRAQAFVVLDYDRYWPIAPGMVLIKSPGHTSGSQMVYVALDSGAEYLFVGDSAWHMDAIRQQAPKDAPWLTEDNATLMPQLAWLEALRRSASGLHLVVSHDDDQRQQYIAARILGGRFE